MKHKIDYLQAIEERRSRRTYTTEPIATDKVAYLQERILAINGESGLSITWLEDGSRAFTALKSYGMFKNVGSVIVLKGSQTVSDLFERIGYYGELLALEATALGLGTCWIAAFDLEAAREVLEIPDHALPLLFTPLGYPKAGPRGMGRKNLEELVRYEKW